MVRTHKEWRVFRRMVTAVIACMCLQGTALAMPQAIPPKPNLTILVDDALLLPMTHIARAYATQTRTPLTISIKRDAFVEQQIEQGLEAHVLITGNGALSARLAEHGLTDVTNRHEVARTTLAFVTAGHLSKHAAIAKRVSFAAMLAATPSKPVFVHTPESLDGMRAQALLSGQDFSPNLAKRIAVKETVEDILSALRDSDGFALMLATDAANEKDLAILAVLPEEISQPIRFEAIVLGSELMNESRTFAGYLRGRDAQRIFTRFGFQTPAE